jgi:predicted outer membrane lipoprotein
MVLLEAVDTITLVTAIVGLLGTLIAGIVAIINALKAKKYGEAAKISGTMFDKAAHTLDSLKKRTDGTDARGFVADALVDLGTSAESAGIKDAMDAKLRELGLDDKR